MTYWEQKDQQFIWHPFTQMQEWEKESPTIIVEGGKVMCNKQDQTRYDVTVINVIIIYWFKKYD